MKNLTPRNQMLALKEVRRGGALVLSLALLCALAACAAPDRSPDTDGEKSAGPTTTRIILSDSGVTVDGEPAAGGETAAVYTARDIIFYLEGQDITYGEGTEADGHSQAEADRHTVVHITQPGVYSLSGTLSAGQIAVDLGEDAEDDPDAVVTLILDGVDITCTVAPAIIFYNVYECGSHDEDAAAKDVDTSAAGANVIIADGTENHISGSYVARIYKPGSVELSEDGTEVIDSKKLHKYDGAFYSKMSMNVAGGELGTGMLTIEAENEGLDSELHLTINGGNIRICSGNDGINTNEDGVSVTTINGGSLTIRVDGATGEGDGIDSNGWLVINGGTVVAAACADSQDAGIDSDMGIYINGGSVAASGNMLDRIEAGGQPYAVFGFQDRQTGGTSLTLKAEDGSAAGCWTPANDFTYLVVSSPELEEGTYTLWSGEIQLAGIAGESGFGKGGGFGPRPEDGEPPQGDPGQMPDGGEPPQGDPGQKPDGGEPPQGDPGQMPEGGQPPQGMGDWPRGNDPQMDSQRSTDFVLTGDGGSFSRITEAGAEQIA